MDLEGKMIHSRGFEICLPLLVAWVTRLQRHRWVNCKGSWQDGGRSSTESPKRRALPLCPLQAEDRADRERAVA